MARFRVRLQLPATVVRRLPPPLRGGLSTPAAGVIILLICINLVVWAAVAAVLHFNPILVAPAVLSYTLGLRHALDADHIAAIDLTTRRLVASGQRPVAVGTFFSLGHSTVVVMTCIVVAATSGALRERFDDFTKVGNIIGTSVSAAFLLILCAGNTWVLVRLVRRLRAVLQEEHERMAAGDEGDDVDLEAARRQLMPLEGVGFLSRVFKTLFKAIDRPWKMFPLGILFGLGFDTSSEIAVLGIASLHGAQGTSLWLILIFPVLFTCTSYPSGLPHAKISSLTATETGAMCLVDTTDGALMMVLYTSKAFARDHVAILYYSIVLTGITIFVSAFIGIIQVLSLVQNVAEPEGRFWDGVGAIGDQYQIIGGAICGAFLMVGIASVVAYKPWRTRLEQRRRSRSEAAAADAQDEREDDVCRGRVRVVEEGVMPKTAAPVQAVKPADNAAKP